MISTKIQIKPHLMEYFIGKYGNFDKTAIHFPDNLDIYHLIFNLTEKRPATVFSDSGNLEIFLPYPRGSKQPQVYNYLSVKSQKIIEKKMKVMFWADFRDYVDFEHHQKGISYIESIFVFMRKYGIESISEDALQKNYYRWRKKVRNNEKKAYISKKSL